MNETRPGNFIVNSQEDFNTLEVTKDETAQKTVYDLMLQIDEIERIDLPLLNSSLFEPGLSEEIRVHREQMIQKLRHNIGQTSLLVAELVHAVERGDITFEKVQKHPQLNKIKRLFGEIEAVIKSGDIGNYLNKKKKEAEKYKVDIEKDFLPPASFDPHWQTIEDIELANTLLVYEIQNDIALDPAQKQNAEIVMSFLSDREVIKRTFEYRDLEETKNSGRTIDISNFAFTLGWIKTHEPKVWEALVELSQGENGKQLIKLLLGQGAKNRDLYPELGSPKDKRSQELAQALPNSLLIAVHNSGRLVHEGLRQGGEFAHEQEALVKFYGSLPEDMEYDSDYHTIHIEVAQILEQAADGRDKITLDEGLKFLQKPNKNALSWEGWNNFFVVLNKVWDNLSDKSKNEIVQACVVMATYRQKNLAQIEAAIEREKEWKDFVTEKTENIDIGYNYIYGRANKGKLKRLFSFLRNPVKSLATATEGLASKRVKSAEANEQKYIGEFMGDLPEYHRCVDFINQKSKNIAGNKSPDFVDEILYKINLAYLSSVAKANEMTVHNQNYKNYDFQSVGNCDGWRLKIENLDYKKPFSYNESTAKAKLCDVVTSLRNADLGGSDLSNINWGYVPASGANFVGADFKGRFNLQNGNFEEANFQKAVLYLDGPAMRAKRKVNFQKANLQDVDFVAQVGTGGADIFSDLELLENPYSMDYYSTASKIEADFSGADLKGVNFHGVSVEGCFFDNAQNVPDWIKAGLVEEDADVVAEKDKRKERHVVFRNKILLRNLFAGGAMSGGPNYLGACIEFADVSEGNNNSSGDIKIRCMDNLRLRPFISSYKDLPLELQDAKLPNAFLSNFVGTGKIQDSYFYQTIFDKCSFDGCEIKNTSFRHTIFNPFSSHRLGRQFINYKEIVKRGIESAGASPCSVFVNCKIDKVDFGEAVLLGLYIGKTELNGVNFEKADFNPRKKAHLHEADIVHGLEVKDSVFNQTSFKEAKVSNSKFNQVRFDNVDFSGANFVDAYFDNCHFNKINADSTNFKGAVFKDCDFSGTDLSLAELDGAKFVKPKNLNDWIAKNIDKNGVFHY